MFIENEIELVDGSWKVLSGSVTKGTPCTTRHITGEDACCSVKLGRVGDPDNHADCKA